MEWLVELIPGKILSMTWSFSLGGKAEGENASFFEKFGEEVGSVGVETAVLASTLLLLKYFVTKQLEELEGRYPISIFINGLIVFLVTNVLAIYLYMVHKMNRVLFNFSL